MALDPGTSEDRSELLALAMALTGRSDAAADLVGQVLAHRRPGAPESARVSLRDLLVQQFTGRRALAGEAAAEAPSLPAELARVASGLDRLSPVQRAALTLSSRERVTHAEIAAILDRPPATIDRSLTEAARAVDADPVTLAATLDALARQAPTPEAVRPAIHRHRQRRRTRRRRIAGSAIGVVAALVVAFAVPAVVLPRLPAFVRQNSEWVLGFEVDLPPGWTVGGRYLAPDADVAWLDHGEVDHCTITVGTPDATEPPRFYKTAKVHGRPGGYSNSTSNDGYLDLSWTYAPSAQAQVSCSPMVEPERFLQRLARQVRFHRGPLELPYALTRVPAGYQVGFVGRVGDTHSTLLSRSDHADQSLGLQFPAEPPSSQARPASSLGRPAELYLDRDDVTVCLNVQDQLACLSSESESGSEVRTGRQAATVREVLAVADQVRFAPRLDDEGTWFDATDALPR